MDNNDVLRSLRYTLDLSDKRVVELISTAGGAVTREELDSYLLAESDEGRQLCPDQILAAFLNGLISDRRGARDNQPAPETKLDNNLILKKLRIAFSLRDGDVHALVKGSGSKLSRTELNAVFQKPGHKNYVVCGDQLLRQFLTGLTKKMRTPDNPVYKQ